MGTTAFGFVPYNDNADLFNRVSACSYGGPSVRRPRGLSIFGWFSTVWSSFSRNTFNAVAALSPLLGIPIKSGAALPVPS